MIAFLADESGLINARNKEVKVRPLDKQKIKNNRVVLQIINVALPLAFIVMLGMVKVYFRKRKYGRFQKTFSGADGVVK